MGLQFRLGMRPWVVGTGKGLGWEGACFGRTMAGSHEVIAEQFVEGRVV